MENKRRVDGDAAMLENTPVSVKPVAVHLSEEIQSKECLYGILHSAFERAMNYRIEISGESRLVTVLREDTPLMPDSVIFSLQDYWLLKNEKEKSVIFEKGFMQIGSMRAELSQSVSLEFGNRPYHPLPGTCLEEKLSEIQRFIQKSEKRSDLERLPIKYRAALTQFAVGILSNIPDLAIRNFQEAVGAGKGLTPAADDAMLGVLAGSLLHLCLKGEQQHYLKVTKKILEQLCLEKPTTEISAKYLKCACRGNFPLPVCQLIDSLTGRGAKNLEELLILIASVGHTSGMDMLYGFMVAGAAAGSISEGVGSYK